MTNEQIAQLAGGVAGQLIEHHVARQQSLSADAIATIAAQAVAVARAIAAEAGAL